MRTDETQSDHKVIAALNDLLQLDHDAVEAYTIAINTTRSDTYRETLVGFRADHKRHIEELAALVRSYGTVPAELPHPTGVLKLAVQAVGAAGGDPALLLAFKAVEGQVVGKYQRMARRRFPGDIADVVKRAAADEERHYAWVERTLAQLGYGEGTIPGRLASVVEGVHKVLANPIEGAERKIMEQVARMRPKRSRKPAASGAADEASGTPGAPGTESGTNFNATRPGSNADRFIAGLRALESRDSVEELVGLFAEDADVSNAAGGDQRHTGRGGARQFWQRYRDAFEHIHSEFTSVVESGRTAMLEWTSRGRLTGGGDVEYRGVSVVEFGDGGIRRFRAYFDPAELATRAPADAARADRAGPSDVQRTSAGTAHAGPGADASTSGASRTGASGTGASGTGASRPDAIGAVTVNPSHAGDRQVSLGTERDRSTVQDAAEEVASTIGTAAGAVAGAAAAVTNAAADAAGDAARNAADATSRTMRAAADAGDFPA